MTIELVDLYAIELHKHNAIDARQYAMNQDFF